MSQPKAPRETFEAVEVIVSREAVQLWHLCKPLDSRPEPCRSCGLPIRWAITRNGRPNPLNAQPDEDGRYVSHFADCRDAKDWRRDRRNDQAGG